MKEMIKKTILTFFLIVAGITASTTIFLLIFYPEVTLYLDLMLQIIAMSFVCALGNFIYYAKYELSKRQMLTRMLIHFLFINAVVISGAFLWKWVTPGILTEFFTLLIMLELVYIIITIINFLLEKRVADEMNQKLRQLNSEEEKKNQ